MYDPVTARFLQADTYAGNINDPLSLNLYTYCLNNPHKYVDPSGHVPVWAIEILRVVTAAISAFFSGKAEYDRQKELGYNEIDWMAVRNVVEFDFLLSYATFGVGSKAAKGASIGAKYFLKQLGKAVAKDAAIGFVVDAGRETARQLATGTKLTNLDFDRIKDAGMVGGIIGGVSTIAGAAAEGIANTKFAKDAISKFKSAAGKGADAIKSSFAKIASMNGKKTGMDAVEDVVKTSYGKSSSFSPKPDTTRINLANGRTRFTPLRESGNPVSAGMQHVIDGHFDRPLGNRRSVFSITVDDSKGILQRKDVIASPISDLGGGQYKRVVNVGRDIGNTALIYGGKPTSWMEIITDVKGNIITTYPVPKQ